MEENHDQPRFFENPSEFRSWLAENHGSAEVLWVGFYKKSTGMTSITWPESVDEALCFGWIDGLRKSIDETAYKIRFTPRRTTSIWSAVNLERFEVLRQEGRMRSAGIKAHENRKKKNANRYSYEQGKLRMKKEYVESIRSNPKAWAFYKDLPPSVKKPTIWYVMSAKRQDTQKRRLQIVIESSEQGRKIPPLRRKGE